jgi:phosphorylase kinase gamma subunit
LISWVCLLPSFSILEVKSIIPKIIHPPTNFFTDLFGTPGYLAPETLRCQWYEDAEGYGLEADDWALGVILYTLLAGYAPFFHRQQLRMMRMIQEGKYEFNREQWENITEEAKDLVNI